MEQKWKQYKKQYGDDINLMLEDFTDQVCSLVSLYFICITSFFCLAVKTVYKRAKTTFFTAIMPFLHLYHYIFSFLLILVLLGFEG